MKCITGYCFLSFVKLTQEWVRNVCISALKYYVIQICCSQGIEFFTQ